MCSSFFLFLFGTALHAHTHHQSGAGLLPDDAAAGGGDVRAGGDGAVRCVRRRGGRHIDWVLLCALLAGSTKSIQTPPLSPPRPPTHTHRRRVPEESAGRDDLRALLRHRRRRHDLHAALPGACMCVGSSRCRLVYVCVCVRIDVLLLNITSLFSQKHENTNTRRSWRCWAGWPCTGCGIRSSSTRRCTSGGRCRAPGGGAGTVAFERMEREGKEMESGVVT